MTVCFLLAAIVLVLVVVLQIWVGLGVAVHRVRSETWIILIDFICHLIEVLLPCIWRCLLHTHLSEDIIYGIFVHILFVL